ncbi:MAG: universal stress protein [Syntrophales bacterium]|jgi:nucleotide-binding universal stress UspA family protein
MYKKILVPLDGSKLAECALPHVVNLAKGDAVGEVILLNVVEIPSVWMAEGLDFISIKNAQFSKAQKYLANLQSQLSSEGIKVKAEVLEGKTAQSIIEYSKEKAVNLIVIVTHGYTGIKQLMFGSVALRVLHDAHIPVLLIRPERD